MHRLNADDTDSHIHSCSLSPLRRFSLSGGSHPFLIGSSCVRIYDLYFTWHSGAQEVEEFAVLGVHDGSLDELHHRVAAVLKLRVTPQAERPWRWREVFVFIYHM